MSFFRLAGLTMLGLLMGSPALAQTHVPDITLEGDLTGADHQTYRYLPFTVPAGVTRVSVDFSYTGKEQKSTIDLGLDDPNGFRGWSGGNKAAFTVSATDATPSYLPGPVTAGTWKLVLGVPNMRPDGHAHYVAHIRFAHAGDPLPQSVFTDAPLNDQPGWYRGDLHGHTAHSDGSCLSLGGKRVPCPVFLTLEAAKKRGLDFIAVTDHNGISQNNDLRELQPYFDTLLLIPGREITTFHGHANVFGTTEFLPFTLGTPELPAINDLIKQAHAKGALFSINHPAVPSGEACMGCGWTAPDTDYGLVDAIEVVNGGSDVIQHGVEGPLNGIPFWEARLNAGDRLTAIGGGDNHDAIDTTGKAPPVGFPTTVIHAANLSQQSLLDGLKHGRVFIDMEPSAGPNARVLDLSATAGKNSAVMGENLAVSPHDRVLVNAEVRGASGSTLEVILNGQRIETQPIPNAQANLAFALTSQQLAGIPGPAWVRVNVRDAQGHIAMVSNPIYLNHQK